MFGKVKWKGFGRPWLQRFHPNFFLIYVISIVHFLWAGVNGIAGDPDWFKLDFLEYVNVVSPTVWGVAYLGVGALMAIGLFREDFKYARLGLATGLFLESSRFLLILASVLQVNQAANTLANLVVVVGVLATQLMEPPVNPSSIR